MGLLQVEPFRPPFKTSVALDDGSTIKVLICPDVHVPSHDRRALAVFRSVLTQWEPDHLVILGDWCDFYSVMAHRKDPRRRMSLKQELRVANAELDRLYGQTKTWFCEGNHETRLTRYIADHCPDIAEITPTAREALRIKERRWNWVPYGESFNIGKVHFTHDLGYAGVSAARQSVNAFGGCIVLGHTHGADIHYVSTVSGDRYFGATMGWLGDPSAIDYQHQAKTRVKNQHGFGVARIERRSGLGWVTFVPILNGKAVVEGQLYKA